MATAAAPLAPEIFARPPRGTIPLSKGGDLVVDFQQRIDGVHTDYASGVFVRLVIDTPHDTIDAIATISGFHAFCKVESEVADSINAGVAWRCLVSYPTVPRTEIVAMNGTITRAD